MRPAALAALIVLVLVGTACSSQPTAFDDWRTFLGSTRAADRGDLSQRVERLQRAQQAQPRDVTRLQLAYLLTRSLADQDAEPESIAAGQAAAEALLLEIDARYELVPIRDALLRELRLAQQLVETREQLQVQAVEREQLLAQARECDSAREQLLALRLKHAQVQGEITTCTEQLEALKRIENTMSEEPVVAPVLPRQ